MAINLTLVASESGFQNQDSGHNNESNPDNHGKDRTQDQRGNEDGDGDGRK